MNTAPNPAVSGLRIRDIVDLRPQAFTDVELATAYNAVIWSRHDEARACERAPFDQVDAEYNPGVEPVTDSFVLEAITVDRFSRTERRMQAVVRVLNKHLGDGELRALDPLVGKPKKSGAFAYVTVQLPFSDGQSVSVVFHSPEGDKKRIGPEDQIIAFRWLLNKRDITHVVAPEGGAEVSLDTIAVRITQLVQKNTARFASQQKEAVEEQRQLNQANADFDAAEASRFAVMERIAATKAEYDTLTARIANTKRAVEKQKAINADLEAKIAASRATKDNNATVGGDNGTGGGERSGEEVGGMDGFTSKLVSMGFERGPDGEYVLGVIVPGRYGAKEWAGQVQVYTTLVDGKVNVNIVTDRVDVPEGVQTSFKSAQENASNAFGKAVASVKKIITPLQTLESWKNQHSSFMDKVKIGGEYKVKASTGNFFQSPAVAKGSDTQASTMLPGMIFMVGDHTTMTFNYREIGEKLASGDIVPWDGSPANPGDFDPTKPTNYAAVMADEAMQLKYQDNLDSFFQERIVDVRNALRGLGWEGDQGGILRKEGHTLLQKYKQVGAGANVVGMHYEISDVPGFFMSETLERTPEEMAKAIDSGLTSFLAQRAGQGEAKPAAPAVILPSKDQMNLPAKRAARLLYAHGWEADALKPDFHKKLANDPWLPLVIETHEAQQTGAVNIHFIHYIEENGDLVIDSEMVFLARNGILTLAETAVRGPRGEIRGRDASFANVFSKNLIQQGFEKALGTDGGSAPGTGKMDYTAWEDAVTTAVESLLEVSRSDAQGIVEAQAARMKTAWEGGMSPEDMAATFKPSHEPQTMPNPIQGDIPEGWDALSIMDGHGWMYRKTVNGETVGVEVTPNGASAFNIETVSKGGEVRTDHAVLMSRDEAEEEAVRRMKALDVQVASEPAPASGPDPAETEALAKLDSIINGEHDDNPKEIDRLLDEAAAGLEGLGMLDLYDDRLNQAADHLTVILKKRAAEVM